MHVLIAESEPRLAADAARALRRSGMTVDVAMNARTVSALSATTEYDVIVVEQAYRQDLHGNRTAVVVISDPGAPVAAYPSDTHLSKPFDLDDLIACVQELASR